MHEDCVVVMRHGNWVGDSKAECGEGTKSSKVAIVGGQRAGSAEN